MGNDIVQEGEARTLEITLQDLDPGVVIYKNNAIYDRNGKREIRGRTSGKDLFLKWGGYVDGELILFLGDGTFDDGNSNFFYKCIGDEIVSSIPYPFYDGETFTYMKSAGVFFTGNRKGILRSINADDGKLIDQNRIAKERITAIAANQTHLYCGTDLGNLFIAAYGKDHTLSLEDPRNPNFPNKFAYNMNGKKKSRVKKIKATDDYVALLAQFLYVAQIGKSFEKKELFTQAFDFDIIGDLFVVSCKYDCDSRNYDLVGFKEYGLKNKSLVFTTGKSHLEWFQYFSDVKGFYAQGRPHVVVTLADSRNRIYPDKLIYDLTSSCEQRKGPLDDLIQGRDVWIINKDD